MDTFTAFVGSLADRLDDHELDGASLAAQLYLSRSHFDRLVAATAGETPARFRRRVLPERAAFRLLTTPGTVLDIALDAGYSSNEAFTRAFERAYGKPPSAWRTNPSHIQLATPNGVHFHPPAGLRLPGRTEVTPMDLINRMVEHHCWLLGQMIDRAAHLDDAVLDQPIQISVEGVDDRPTLRRLLSRLVGQRDLWNNAIALRDYDFSIEAHEPIADLRSRYERVAPAFLEQVRGVVDGGRLDETFVHASSTPPKVYTYGGLIAHVLTFAAHRRTLAAGALVSAGVDDLGNGDPREWVAEL
jgi:AraC family transcriptional regulator